jgi:hypothetical protein
MKQPIKILIITQLLFAILYFVHLNSYQGLGSDFMFFVLMSSFIVSGLIFWQIFKVRNATGIQKTFGLICASFPFLFVLSMLFFLIFSR